MKLGLMLWGRCACLFSTTVNTLSLVSCIPLLSLFNHLHNRVPSSVNPSWGMETRAMAPHVGYAVVVTQHFALLQKCTKTIHEIWKHSLLLHSHASLCTVSFRNLWLWSLCFADACLQFLRPIHLTTKYMVSALSP